MKRKNKEKLFDVALCKANQELQETQLEGVVCFA